MSKKQRDSLYAEVQKHQQTQERANSAGGIPIPTRGGDDAGENGNGGRAYSRSSSSTALSDLDDIGALPDNLLFDLPLTPEDAGEYCSLELLGGSGGSSSSSQSSPEQSGQEFSETPHIKHEYQLLHESSMYTHSPLNGQPEGCSLLEIGQTLKSLHQTHLCFLLLYCTIVYTVTSATYTDSVGVSQSLQSQQYSITQNAWWHLKHISIGRQLFKYDQH